MNLQTAYDHVNKARRGVRINDGFIRALCTWELRVNETDCSRLLFGLTKLLL